MRRGLLRAHPALRPNLLESLRTALGSGDGNGAPVGASYVTIDVEGELTAENVLGTAVIMYGPAAGKPAASKAGLIYIESDGSYIVWRDSGSAWNEIARGEVGIRLAQLAERAHGSLTGVTSDLHHAQAHTLGSHSTKAHAELTDVTADQHHKSGPAGCHASAYPVDNQTINQGNIYTSGDLRGANGVPADAIGAWLQMIGRSGVNEGYLYIDTADITPDAFSPRLYGSTANLLFGDTHMVRLGTGANAGKIKIKAQVGNWTLVFAWPVGYWR